MTPEQKQQERQAFETAYKVNLNKVEYQEKENLYEPLYHNKKVHSSYAKETNLRWRGWLKAKRHAAQSAWISVEDRLPEIETTVLALEKNHKRIYECIFIQDIGFRSMDHWGMDFDLSVTHWQPLPEPPKKESE